MTARRSEAKSAGKRRKGAAKHVDIETKQKKDNAAGQQGNRRAATGGCKEAGKQGSRKVGKQGSCEAEKLGSMATGKEGSSKTEKQRSREARRHGSRKAGKQGYLTAPEGVPRR